MISILIADEKQSHEGSMESSLRDTGYSVLPYTVSGIDAALIADEYKPDLLIVHIQKDNEREGIETAELIHTMYDIPIIFISDTADKDLIKQAMKVEPYGYITKPFTESQLQATTEIALYRIAREKKQQSILKGLDAGSNNKRLHGILPICSSCKSIRDEYGYWHQVEEYIKDRSNTAFTHSICPVCMKKHYPDIF